jgi:hypothetical protein
MTRLEELPSHTQDLAAARTCVPYLGAAFSSVFSAPLRLSFPGAEEMAMKWMTRSHVHVDRVACPWLIKRFVDSEAEFLFVPANQVEDVSGRVSAVPFDSPGVELGHRDGKCSFETIIEKYDLKDKALLRLAKIVHAADTGELDSDPIARGLEAIAVGYSIRFPDDTENLKRQFEVYDALYAWCRLEVAKGE